jgi:hypothetical protein
VNGPDGGGADERVDPGVNAGAKTAARRSPVNGAEQRAGTACWAVTMARRRQNALNWPGEQAVTVAIVAGAVGPFTGPPAQRISPGVYAGGLDRNMTTP